MILSILFGQRKQRFEGEYGPEALSYWDEFSIDENPEGFDQEVSEQKAQLAKEFESFLVIDIVVDQEHISKLLNKKPILNGDIV